MTHGLIRRLDISVTDSVGRGKCPLHSISQYVLMYGMCVLKLLQFRKNNVNNIT